MLGAGTIPRVEDEGLLADGYVSTVRLPTLDKFAACPSFPRPEGFILHECKLAVIDQAISIQNRPKPNASAKRGDMFVAPEVGDYAVTRRTVSAISRRKNQIQATPEYIALEYKDGDVHVPAEHMDILSKYVGDANPALSKIGGADFERVKARVRASLKRLAFDLKKLYAERAESRGFRFPENEAFMREFEDAFAYELTPDQASSVEEIKADMCSEKVMDRL
ncbi:MAG: hypothetical protein ACLRSW_15510, partial [Christensenellaceae bacterium]